MKVSTLATFLQFIQSVQANVNIQTCIYSTNNPFRMRSMQQSETIALMYCLYSVPSAIGQHCVVIIIGTISCSSYILGWNIPSLFLNATNNVSHCWILKPKAMPKIRLPVQFQCQSSKPMQKSFKMSTGQTPVPNAEHVKCFQN